MGLSVWLEDEAFIGLLSVAFFFIQLVPHYGRLSTHIQIQKHRQSSTTVCSVNYKLRWLFVTSTSP